MREQLARTARMAILRLLPLGVFALAGCRCWGC
jgi:hypothetical protein